MGGQLQFHKIPEQTTSHFETLCHHIVSPVRSCPSSFPSFYHITPVTPVGHVVYVVCIVSIIYVLCVVSIIYVVRVVYVVCVVYAVYAVYITHYLYCRRPLGLCEVCREAAERQPFPGESVRSVARVCQGVASPHSPVRGSEVHR